MKKLRSVQIHNCRGTNMKWCSNEIQGGLVPECRGVGMQWCRGAQVKR